MQIHNGAIFAVSLDGKWLFTGSWDRTIKAQELAGDNVEVDVRQIGFKTYAFNTDLNLQLLASPEINVPIDGGADDLCAENYTNTERC
ncbi:hypothetical protein F3Y22_tig00111208pilonHSYRG00274 [Hibiscus syriacus]|uniref:Uncharacterized protein n=1 Tax=Hibiscus syriacus TaxID=106335 RepID=A0A6A2YVV9_HIBSY|nr:hypothetical protein F3Y22_tig00111208pilonHSYRG00274 [Hibiscus syriacus]